MTTKAAGRIIIYTDAGEIKRWIEADDVARLEQELAKLSYFVDPHARGALGRWLTADEMIREWSKRAADFDDEIEAMEAELTALRAAYAVAAAIMRSQPVGVPVRLVQAWNEAQEAGQ